MNTQGLIETALRHSKKLLKTEAAFLLLIAVGWQLLLTITGYALNPEGGLLSHMSRWDSGWYQHIITHTYTESGSPAAPVFYPLFPLLLYIVQALSFGLFSIEFSALLVNTVSVWLILMALTSILRHFRVSKMGRSIALVALLCFPAAFFMHVLYGEALFMAIAFWAYAFALQRKWWAMALLLAVLTAARLPSLLFIGLCGLEYLRAYRWNIRKALNKQFAWFLLTPLGFIAYGLYLLVIRGDFLAMFSAYDATNDWPYQVFNINIFSTIYEASTKVVGSLLNSSFNYELFINAALPLLSLVALVIASVYTWCKLGQKGLPLFIFGIVSSIFFTLNSNVVSVHRYVLPCIVLYIALALYATTKAKGVAVLIACAASLAVQLFLYFKFTNFMFAG